MAKVTNIVRQEAKYTLELTQAEADTLLAILWRVGGDPDTSRRGIADEIGLALYGTGTVSRDNDDIDRGLSFADNR